MKVEVVPIGRLKPDPRNARKHSQRNLKAIEDSLRQFGQQKPIVALEDGTVIAGNGTLEAARALGMKTIAVKWFDDPKKARAYAIADNRTGELADWDDDILESTLTELEKQGADIAALGFDDFGKDGSDTPDPQAIAIRPFKAVHVLVSFDVNDSDKAQELLALVASKYPSAEVSGSAN